jgi:23S rRNA pseudouridine2604 synthase
MTRINKYLAEKQYASRREADVLVQEGKVFINDKKAKLGDYVREGDVVRVEGIEQAKKAYYAYYKARGIVTVNAQYDNEKEIKDVTKFPERVYPLGRLDKESEGLIIFTNDGRLTDALLNPKRKHEKEYSVEVNEKLTNTHIQKLQHGINIGHIGTNKNYVTKPALVRRTGPQSFDIVLTEGKNRQIRRMCGALGLRVDRLKRFRILNIEIDSVKPGQFRKIDGEELKKLLKVL